MNKLSPPRPAATGPDLAVRPGAGVLGLSRPDPLYKSAPRETPEAEPSSEGRLIVGEGIHVKGQIDSCDTLIVEGRVEAALEARELKVCRGGIYSGRASVRAASIDGSFDGELTVEGLLIIRSGGRSRAAGSPATSTCWKARPRRGGTCPRPLTKRLTKRATAA
jgi:hypothetical protein